MISERETAYPFQRVSYRVPHLETELLAVNVSLGLLLLIVQLTRLDMLWAWFYGIGGGLLFSLPLALSIFRAVTRVEVAEKGIYFTHLYLFRNLLPWAQVTSIQLGMTQHGPYCYIKQNQTLEHAFHVDLQNPQRRAMALRLVGLIRRHAGLKYQGLYGNPLPAFSRAGITTAAPIDDAYHGEVYESLKLRAFPLFFHMIPVLLVTLVLGFLARMAINPTSEFSLIWRSICIGGFLAWLRWGIGPFMTSLRVTPQELVVMRLFVFPQRIPWDRVLGIYVFEYRKRGPYCHILLEPRGTVRVPVKVWNSKRRAVVARLIDLVGHYAHLYLDDSAAAAVMPGRFRDLRYVD